MIEFNEDILNNLKCVQCDGYLSCSPVLLKPNGGSICGRCTTTEHGAARNFPYEELATLVAFPCRYQENGCPRKVLFKSLKQHEEACCYRHYICPVVESGTCEWVGPRDKLLAHCEHKHPSRILQHPCVLQHDIRTNSLNNYIMSVFQVLFLIQTKVCTISKKIYHSVRVIGDPTRASDFSYTLEITNGDAKFHRKKSVAPQELLVLQRDTAIDTDINGLLSTLQNYTGTKFKIHIENLLAKKCSKCENSAQLGNYGSRGWLCEDCAPTKRKCKNSVKDCMYLDVPSKTEKHEKHFCRPSNWCHICCSYVKEILDEHRKKEHAGITHQQGSIWWSNARDVYWPISKPDWHIITSDIGTLLCSYSYQEYNSYLVLPYYGFTFEVFSALPNEQLCLYNCELRLTHPITGRSIHRTLDVVYNEACDWKTVIHEKDMRSFLHERWCNVQVDVCRKVCTDTI